jgi:hypothetical protein
MEIHYLQLNPIFDVEDYASPTAANNTKVRGSKKYAVLFEEIKFLHKNRHCAELITGEPSKTCDTVFPQDATVASAAASAVAGSAVGSAAGSAAGSATAPAADFNAKNWIHLAKEMALHFKCLFIYLEDYMRTAWNQSLPYEDANFQFICLSHYCLAGFSGKTKYEEYLNIKPLNRKGTKDVSERIVHPGAYDFFTKHPNGYIKTKTFADLPDTMQTTLREMLQKIRGRSALASISVQSRGKSVSGLKSMQALDSAKISTPVTERQNAPTSVVQIVYELYRENPAEFMSILNRNHLAELQDYALRVYNKTDLKEEKFSASIFLWCDEYAEMACFMKHLKEYDHYFKFEGKLWQTQKRAPVTDLFGR